MSEQTTDRRKIGRRVILSPGEQDSLFWLLHATASGGIISASEERRTDVLRLKAVYRRIGIARAER